MCDFLCKACSLVLKTALHWRTKYKAQSTKLKAHTPKLSLVPQRLERVDFHRPPGWKVTSQERHRNQPHRHKSKSSYVSRRHFKIGRASCRERVEDKGGDRDGKGR